MATVERRLALVEGKVEEQSREAGGLRTAIGQLGERVTQFEARMDRRFEAIDRRFEGIERRLDGIDRKLDQRTDALDQKISSQFMWVVGIQVTTLVAIVAALIAR